MPKQSSSKQKSSRKSSAWSEWVWSEEHGSHYCYRTKRNGELEYQWETPVSSAQEQQQDETVPRAPGELDELAAGVQDLSFSGEHDQEPDLDYGYAYGSDTGGHEPHKMSKSKRNGEITEYAKAQEAEESSPDDEAPLDPFYGARTDTEEATGYAAEYPQDESLPTESGYHQPNGYDPDTQQDYESQETEATSASGQHDFGYPDEGGSSMEPSYGAYSSEAEDDGQMTSKTGRPVYDSEIEPGQLDSRFKVEPSKKFKQGAIFKVVWSEPQGVTTNNTLITEKKLMKDPYGGNFYVGSRRFIVVATDKGHSTCVPILTYQGRGCGKPGVHPMNHGIIHEKNRQPHMLSREPELGFAPVKAKLNAEGERLQKESRINYAKLTTIEHNIKVFFIGSVVKDEIRYIREAVDYCWERKC